MSSLICQWQGFNQEERFQYVTEVWAIVTLDVFLLLFGLAFATTSHNQIQTAIFGSASAGLWLGFACLVAALFVPMLLPLRRRLRSYWKRRLFILAQAPVLFYMIVVLIYFTKSGVFSAGIVSYGLIFNVLSMAGVTLYRPRKIEPIP